MSSPDAFAQALELEKTRRFVADTRQKCLRLDLEIIAKFIDLSVYWYRTGRPESGDRARAQAVKGIDAVRRFLSTAQFLGPESTNSIARRCDELEEAVADLRSANRQG